MKQIFRCDFCDKIGTNKEIYEHEVYCENNPKITKWASEPIKIPYYSRLQQKNQNYYPDYVIENENGVRCIVEIKPYNQTQKPVNENAWGYKEYIKKYSDTNLFSFCIFKPHLLIIHILRNLSIIVTKIFT